MIDALSDIQLRPAGAADIAHFDRLWADAEKEDPPPSDWVSSIYAHE